MGNYGGHKIAARYALHFHAFAAECYFDRLEMILIVLGSLAQLVIVSETPAVECLQAIRFRIFFADGQAMATTSTDVFDMFLMFTEPIEPRHGTETGGVALA